MGDSYCVNNKRHHLPLNFIKENRLYAERVILHCLARSKMQVEVKYMTLHTKDKGNECNY